MKEEYAMSAAFFHSAKHDDLTAGPRAPGTVFPWRERLPSLQGGAPKLMRDPVLLVSVPVLPMVLPALRRVFTEIVYHQYDNICQYKTLHGETFYGAFF